MLREPSTPRPDWTEKCTGVGFDYHSLDGTYWDESACYHFSSAEIDELESAAAELHSMCLQAVEEIIRLDGFEQLAIPRWCVPYIVESWKLRAPSLYGRFDLSYDGVNPPKLLEYNADTPTAALETAVVQWYWLQDVRQGNADQFNSLHERLIKRWKILAKNIPVDTPVHFACVKDNPEDLGNLEYLRDTALQAGLDARFIFIEDIGWAQDLGRFVDCSDHPVRVLFKLYPWEWLVREPFGTNIPVSGTIFVEPAWKMLLSNKGLLAALWKLFPEHPNLLPTYPRPGKIDGAHVRKPILSREGANIAIYSGRGQEIFATEGSYGAEGYIYQALHPLPEFDGNHPVIGAWIVGDQPAGIGIREDLGLVTTNASRFLPHYFD
ncbi:MAG TPA: glutathionylspermidine synthase family protein [Burkholderiales bacterium]|nr:glutathionylspermidine synthase family protein [Burkholderiales bacterium]